ncbi:alpha/beta fold hydrolase [Heliorestis acidaminivorans]|uniref:Alpha/beta fold hydrolase n=1 Tax=Heliorestis acidaminivorans TaxID=553427 RepID=A0A6I0F034_9FIRM|nr:alpha/beta hydrolase [Heliorestis acidaminivorans]KAB2953095.1 alpha/beta fold hydrolase [Heliorestis acidaminivorans]
MPIVALNGTSLYYEIHGQGLPLVFIPGIAVSHGMWAPQRDKFSKTHQVILYDIRGTGRSGPLSWSNRVEDLSRDLSQLLHYLGIKKAAICGLSFGGVIAQRFALDYPQKCSALILVDTFSELRPRDLEEGSLWLMTWLASPMFLLPKDWLTKMVLRFYQQWPLALQCLEKEMKKVRGLEAMKTRWLVRDVNYTEQLEKISCPSLGIVGDQSDLAIRMMKRITDAIPQAELRIVSDSFDPTSLCQREAFDDLLLNFLNRHWCWQPHLYAVTPKGLST